METEQSNHQNWPKADKTVFIEYSTTDKQHPYFMTIMQYQDGQKILIGRISKQYDKNTDKMTYSAVDAKNEPIFQDVSDIYTLKKHFTEHGPELAKADVAHPEFKKEARKRGTDLKAIRTNKEITKDKTIEY